MDPLYKRVGTTKLVIEYNNIIKSEFQEAYKKYNIGNIHNKQYAAHLIMNISSDIFSNKPLMWKISEGGMYEKWKGCSKSSKKHL